MSRLKRFTAPLAILAIALIASLSVVDSADARRGGSFGSRGARTFQAPAATPTAPASTSPIQRSMTQPSAAAPAPGVAPQRGGFFGGFGGSLLGGLALGGLIGMLMGNGFGGLAGGLGFILQIALIGFGLMLLMRFLASRRQPTAAGGAPLPQEPVTKQAFGGLGGFGLGNSGLGGSSAAPARPANARNANDEVGILDSDLDVFERRLAEVQAAFAKEDYAALRAVTTPEMMSYLSEELGQNATNGLRNDVTDVKLLKGDLAEAWREGNIDYATVAMCYESCDVMRNRTTGEIVSGEPGRASETTEVWTFTRRSGEEWKLSAIQEV
ncbi:hypothetical protein C3941_07740 [Kaistia algarum]|uniref:Tim44 domain-containing protein n=1 Tax=Kaistia algarum TaxID=2083279 RepID=UPI000CE902C2|nr:TIM44-like domain-containing protein [Kaistia algarum]MCX5511947.1 TIM44-like domain-containing protein [Kaistia algarum]PPE80079.1 hypothetical protein C3941_07740 [Kaistia algarum]